MTTSLPDGATRLRCGHCGNLTRFDVVRVQRIREFWHADLAGQVTVEQVEVLDEQVDAVVCRWCSASNGVELVARPDLGGPVVEAPGDGGP
jgi:hypothetical protein